MINKVLSFFDKFEDKVRLKLSHHPILYTFIGATAIVLFWRGVWHTADILATKGGIVGFLFYEPVNLIIVVVILLATGLFVSYFIGDTILISGLVGQKKINEKTEKEIKEEELNIQEIKSNIADIKNDMDKIKDIIKKDHKHSHKI